MAAPSGHLQVVESPRTGQRWVALWRDADGRHKKRLGPAWVRAHGSTERGGTKWRAAAGRKPDGFLSPKDAEEELRKILASAPRGKLPALKRHTFGEACAEWLRYIEFDRDRRPSTLSDYRNTVRLYLLPRFGKDTEVRTITTDDIDVFREHLLFERQLSRRTAQKILVLLHGILKRAKRKKWIDANPAEDAERITLKRSGDFNVLSPNQIENVVRCAADDQDAAIFTTAAFSGLRMSELRALRWNDLDFAGERIIVRKGVTRWQEGRPKSGQVRAVPMSEQIARALDGLSRRERFTGPTDLVFCNQVGGFVDDGKLRLRFYAALQAAGLGYMREKDDPVVFHDLRHTFGTLAVQAFPLSDVKAFMGHESISTTMIYVHHVPQTDAAAKLTKLLSTGATTGLPSPAAQ
ncbi:MAG: tyrosine-type recombinase/integrase [Solirubrobacteraceae bacterium]